MRLAHGAHPQFIYPNLDLTGLANLSGLFGVDEMRMSAESPPHALDYAAVIGSRLAVHLRNSPTRAAT